MTPRRPWRTHARRARRRVERHCGRTTDQPGVRTSSSQPATSSGYATPGRNPCTTPCPTVTRISHTPAPTGTICSVEPEKRTGGSKLDFFRIKKKQYKWAIKPDVVILILFVLWCTFTYKALIHGNYWGVAVHPISEFQNDSLSYWSSSSSENDHSEFYPEEEDYGDELSLAADEPAFAEGQLNQALTNDYRE